MQESNRQMWTLIFIIGMIWVFGKLFIVGIKAAWSISKFIVTVILLPLVLIGLAIKGMMILAFIALIVLGIAAMCDTV